MCACVRASACVCIFMGDRCVLTHSLVCLCVVLCCAVQALHESQAALYEASTSLRANILCAFLVRTDLVSSQSDNPEGISLAT